MRVAGEGTDPAKRAPPVVSIALCPSLPPLPPATAPCSQALQTREGPRESWGPGRESPGEGTPCYPRGGPGLARSCPQGSFASAGRLRPPAPGTGRAAAGDAPAELPTAGGSCRAAARSETRRSGYSRGERGERTPGRDPGEESRKGYPGRGPGEGCWGGVPGTGVPARPTGAGAARCRRRLQVAASFPGCQSGEEVARPGLEAGWMSLPGASAGPASRFPAPPGPASKVEAEPAAEGWLEGGGGREEGRGGRWGQSPSGGAGTARAWGRGKGHPTFRGGSAIRHGRRCPQGPARLLAQAPPPRTQPPAAAVPPRRGGGDAPGVTPLGQGCGGAAPLHSPTPSKGWVKPDVPGAGKRECGGWGWPDPPVGAALTGPACKGKNVLLLEVKAGSTSPFLAVTGFPDAPALGSVPRPQRESPGSGQSGAAARRGGGAEPGAWGRGPAPRPPRAATRGRSRPPLPRCKGSRSPFPATAEATPARGGGAATLPAPPDSSPGAHTREQPRPPLRTHIHRGARCPGHTPRSTRSAPHPPPVRMPERSDRYRHTPVVPQHPSTPTSPQDTLALPSLLHGPGPPPAALPRSAGLRSLPGAASSHLAPVENGGKRNNQEARTRHWPRASLRPRASHRSRPQAQRRACALAVGTRGWAPLPARTESSRSERAAGPGSCSQRSRFWGGGTDPSRPPLSTPAC